MKPDIWNSEHFLNLSLAGRECFRYLIGMCDDEGLIKSSPRHLLLNACRNVIVPLEEIDDQWQLMAEQRMILPYEFGIDTYVWVVSFRKHNLVERPTATILPRPPHDAVKNVIAGTVVHEDVAELLESWGLANYSPNNRDKTRINTPGKGRGKGYIEETNVSSARSLLPAEPERADVDSICSRLVALNVERGFRHRTITAAWRRDARLLLDRDAGGHPLEEVLGVLEWACSHTFWAPNVQGVPGFRDKYDTIKGQWERDRRAKPPGELRHQANMKNADDFFARAADGRGARQ